MFSLLVTITVAVGCTSTQGRQEEPRARDGIAEYRQVTVEASRAMHAALGSLATVSAQSNGCPPEVLSVFSAKMRQLQVESLPLRARMQAMQARGVAYFESWHEHVAQVKDPEVRALAEQQRPALEESFRRIRLLSQEGREAFEPFASSLRKVRNALEGDPASLHAGPMRDWIATARQNGEHVEKCLEGIVGELDRMRAMITPPGRGAKPQSLK